MTMWIRERYLKVKELWAQLEPQAAARNADASRDNYRFYGGHVSSKAVWVCSLAHRAKSLDPGRIFVVPAYLAANLLVDKTHRLATRKEIADWNKEQRERKRLAGKPVKPDPGPVTIHHHYSAPTVPVSNVELVKQGLAGMYRDLLNHPRAPEAGALSTHAGRPRNRALLEAESGPAEETLSADRQGPGIPAKIVAPFPAS